MFKSNYEKRAQLKKTILKLETIKKSNEVMIDLQGKEIEEMQKTIKYWQEKYENLRLEKIDSNLEKRIINQNLNAKINKLIKREVYNFDYSHIGDISLGRPTLGNTTRVEVYRLMQFSLKDIIEDKMGSEEAEIVFYKAGKIAGQAFYQNILPKAKSLEEFIVSLKEILFDLKIGILEVEKDDFENEEMTITVAEDLDCSGIPSLGYEICAYDEGFIEAILESYTSLSLDVKEVDCWAKGDRICRFHIVQKV